MSDLAQAVRSGAAAAELEACDVPTHYRAAHLRREDVGSFTRTDRDRRKTIHVGPAPTPELAPDEGLVAGVASSIKINAVWSAAFLPVPTFDFLARLGRQGRWGARHDQP